ncbi:DUF4255 domain-containing protein [Streptomyces sp. F63]|uniref:DUF4255 domain-containing protein n=1 Tax=Streptomyces sp. F63 TaxID=2824887 RepID=UPI001B393953|nr:DUF4255 domain-containing protein [Streptomyces sp. F63]MBQ0986083.1 DUF4255 domain-containing protein [Streptomyces sp. F63]
MSNALAIATVTQALAHLIANNLTPEFNEAVRVEPRKPPAEPPPDPLITVFCYQVTPNASMRNNDLPTRAADGTLVQRAAAALDLHYLISAYGEEAELVGQRLIGCVVRTLHEIPVLPRDVIAQAAERPHLAGSDLADALQKVRFTPTQMDIDETSKLWGMLHQTPYSLSVAYQASLVLIEGRERPVPVPPVERHTVRAVPFGAPGAPVPPGGGAGPVDGPARAGGTEAGAREAGGTEAGGTSRASGRASRAGRNSPAASGPSAAGPGTALAAAAAPAAPSSASAATPPAASAGAAARRTTARAGRTGAASPAARTRAEETGPATAAARTSRTAGAPSDTAGTGRGTASAPTGRTGRASTTKRTGTSGSRRKDGGSGGGSDGTSGAAGAGDAAGDAAGEQREG